jgi:hypothetical protein
MFLLNVRIFPIFIFILLLASTMSSDTIEVRVLLRHYWKKGLSQRKAAEEINEVEGEGTTSKSAAGRWFKRFDAGNFDPLISRKRALFQQDNAKPHTAKKTKDKFEELDGVELLPHPAYSPDCAPSDYGLFRSMQHFLKGRRFESFEEVEEACQEFFDSKPSEWYFDQIRKLADRWQKVIDNDGLYFEE